MTVAASEEALKKLKGTPLALPTGSISTGTPGVTTNPLSHGPPPPKKLGDQLNNAPFFKSIAEHYETDNWVDLLNGSAPAMGNKYSKQLAAYVSDKMNIDYVNAVEYLPDVGNIRILEAAGVTLLDLVSEIWSRDIIWNNVPYLQYLVRIKYPSHDSEEYKKTKRGIIDALSDCTRSDCIMLTVLAIYDQLFARIKDDLRHKDIKILATNSILPRDKIYDINSQSALLNILFGMLSRVMHFPEPNIDDPHAAVGTLVYNITAIVSDKYKCAKLGESAITESCASWMQNQTSAISEELNLQQCIEKAKELLPAFVAVYA